MAMDLAEAIDFVSAAKQAHRAGCMCPKCKHMRSEKVGGKIKTNKIKVSQPSSKQRFNDKVKEIHEKQVINLDPKKKKTVEARKFSSKQRSKLADKGVAKPDGSYPIANSKDLGNAVKDFHRANGSPSDAAHIKKRAKALGENVDLSAGGPGSGRHEGNANPKQASVLRGLGFKPGNTIKQSASNQMTVWHGKGPGGNVQQVMLTPTTFSHISNPATKDAVVHARMEPKEGLEDHMINHWATHMAK